MLSFTGVWGGGGGGEDAEAETHRVLLVGEVGGGLTTRRDRNKLLPSPVKLPLVTPLFFRR